MTQWIKFVRGDEYFELIDWTGKSLPHLLSDYGAQPELEHFFAEIFPCLHLPEVPAGKDAGQVFAGFVEGRSFDQAYALVGPPS